MLGSNFTDEAGTLSVTSLYSAVVDLELNRLPGYFFLLQLLNLWLSSVYAESKWVTPRRGGSGTADDDLGSRLDCNAESRLTRHRHMQHEASGVLGLKTIRPRAMDQSQA